MKSHLKRCFPNSLFLLTLIHDSFFNCPAQMALIDVKTWWFPEMIKSAAEVDNKCKVMTCVRVEIQQEHHSFL